MVWCSGWRLASAVSNAGGLGLLGSGSMNAELLRMQIKKTKEATHKPFGVNIPLMYSKVEELIQVVIDENVPIVFTSAGSPATFTQRLKENGIKVAHVVSNLKFALKCQDNGVDAIVAEGVEAGGHNGKEETTTMVLIPLLKQYIQLPLIAAGGVATGRGMLAAMSLGADGVQIGSRFVTSIESSAHQSFKERVLATEDGGTRLALRNINPVRLIRNEFSSTLEQAELNCKSKDELLSILGKGRSRVGMLEGDLINGELEIGQVAAIVKEIIPAKEIINNIITEYNSAVQNIVTL